MVIIVRKCYQKSVDMGRKLEENMYGLVGFSISVPRVSDQGTMLFEQTPHNSLLVRRLSGGHRRKNYTCSFTWDAKLCGKSPFNKKAIVTDRGTSRCFRIVTKKVQKYRIVQVTNPVNSSMSKKKEITLHMD